MAVNLERLAADEAAVHNAIVRGSLVTCDSTPERARRAELVPV